MAETTSDAVGNVGGPSTQTAPEDALLDLRSEIVKQISSELSHEHEEGAFAKYVSHTKIPGT